MAHSKKPKKPILWNKNLNTLRFNCFYLLTITLFISFSLPFFLFFHWAFILKKKFKKPLFKINDRLNLFNDLKVFLFAFKLKFKYCL